MSLIKEINDLRSELKRSRTHCHDLEAVLKIAHKQGFDKQAALAATVPRLPPTGLAQVEPPDCQRVVEIQRAEIGRLRSKLREVEGGGRQGEGEGRGVRGPHTPPGGRLPPVQASTLAVQ